MNLDYNHHDGSPLLDVTDSAGNHYEHARGSVTCAVRSTVTGAPWPLTLEVCAGTSINWLLMVVALEPDGLHQYQVRHVVGSGWQTVHLGSLPPQSVVGVAMVRFDVVA